MLWSLYFEVLSRDDTAVRAFAEVLELSPACDPFLLYFPGTPVLVTGKVRY